MRKMITLPKGAIFDQDGLLFDTEAVFEQSWLKAGDELGLNITSELTHKLSGCGKRELTAVIAETFPEADSSAVVERAFHIAAATQLSMTPIMKPGVREILEFCKKFEIRTAVASSSMRYLVDHNLEVTGLMKYFDAIVTGRDVLNGKPAPDIFLLAAERIGIPVSECVVFEDAFSGIRAAHAAGCRPVLIPDRTPPTSEISDICETYSTLVDALAEIWG